MKTEDSSFESAMHSNSKLVEHPSKRVRVGLDI